MPSNTQYKAIIEMFRNCPFDNSYSHTLEPMAIANKLSWLESNCGYKSEDDRYEQYMYVRLDSATNKGTFKLQCLDIWAYSYNYAYINNLRGEVYFAFITGCRYVNDATQPPEAMSRGVYEFDFEIDLLMSNLHNVNQLKPCLVARHHSTTDNIGDNIVAEPCAVYEKKVSNGYSLLKPDNAGTGNIYAILYVLLSDNTTCHVRDGVVTAPSVYCIKISTYNPSTDQYTLNQQGLQSLWLIIKAHEGTNDVVSIAMVNDLYSPIVEGWIGDTSTPLALTGSIPNISDSDTLDGYLPKNKKLYTYPYNYASIVNGNGNEMLLRYEYWKTFGNTNRFRYRVTSTTGLPVTYQLRPMGYSDEYNGSNGGISWDKFIEINGLPTGSWAYNVYEQWKTMNTGNIIGAIAKSTVSTVSNLGATYVGAKAMSTLFEKTIPITDTMLSAGLSVGGADVNTAIGLISQAYDESQKGEKLSGTLAGSSVNFTGKTFGFSYARQTIPYENAKIIDDFFTRYGYAQNRIMTPNPTARPKFTFIQTGEPCYVNDSSIQGGTNGSANSTQMTIINRCFMNGITFWNRTITKDTIFKYDTLDNSPT